MWWGGVGGVFEMIHGRSFNSTIGRRDADEVNESAKTIMAESDAEAADSSGCEEACRLGRRKKKKCAVPSKTADSQCTMRMYCFAPIVPISISSSLGKRKQCMSKLNHRRRRLQKTAWSSMAHRGQRINSIGAHVSSTGTLKTTITKRPCL